MKVCGFIGQMGINMPNYIEEVLKQDLKQIVEEFDVIYVSFYGEFQNYVLHFLRENFRKGLKIVGIHGYDNSYNDLEQKYLGRLYDDVIKINEQDMFLHTNQIILKNCSQLYFYVNENRHSDELIALNEARNKDMAFKNYFKYIKL